MDVAQGLDCLSWRIRLAVENDARVSCQLRYFIVLLYERRNSYLSWDRNGYECGEVACIQVPAPRLDPRTLDSFNRSTTDNAPTSVHGHLRSGGHAGADATN